MGAVKQHRTQHYMRKGGLMYVIWAFVLSINFVRRTRKVLSNPALRRHFSVRHNFKATHHRACFNHIQLKTGQEFQFLATMRT
jgi:hypothetical protein